MKTVMKKTKIAAACAVALGLGLGAAGNAQAGAYTFAHSIVELTVFNLTAGRIADAGDFTTLSILDQSGALANIGSVPGIAATSSLTTPDTLLACQGVTCGGIAENDWSQIKVGHFGRADTVGTGAIITGLVNPIPASVGVLSEIAFDHTDIGTTSSNASDTTTFAFTVADPTDFRFDLSATTETESLLHTNAAVPPSTVGSNGTWTVSIFDDNNNPIFDWSPNKAAGGISGGTELSDNIDLTFSSTTAIPDGIGTGLLTDSGLASASISLAAGQYNFTINQTSQSSAIAVKVPEPAVIGLLGIGLLGMTAFRRRGNKAT